MPKIKETKIYNINDFLDWYESDELTLAPIYQRNAVWSKQAKSYLMDSIIRGLPIPQIFIRQNIDTSTRRNFREVIDGQQRLRSIIEFVNNEYSIMNSHNKEFGGKFYKDLDDNTKENFLYYQIPVEVINTKDNALVYNMFARLNTNNKTLNKQELRNAIYWGEFKVFIYEESIKWQDFFKDIKTFNDSHFSRMIDIEFLTGICILFMDGVITESGSVLDGYYKKNNDNFSEQAKVSDNLNLMFKIMKKIFIDNMYNTRYFHRKNYFFTLIAAISHQVFGLTNLSVVRNSDFSSKNINANISRLISNLDNFESRYDFFIEDKIIESDEDKNLITFEQNHRTRTTSKNERIERIEILSKYLFV